MAVEILLGSADDAAVARRTDSWVLSRGALVALGVAVLAVVVIVVSGVREQNRRKIPAAQSVAIWSAVTSTVETGPVQFGQVSAQALAAIVNHLGRMPNGTYNCGDDTGRHYRLVFSTVSGDVEVQDNLGGCLGVSISGQGSDWGAGKWDPIGQLAGAIQAKFARNDRR